MLIFGFEVKVTKLDFLIIFFHHNYCASFDKIAQVNQDLP